MADPVFSDGPWPVQASPASAIGRTPYLSAGDDIAAVSVARQQALRTWNASSPIVWAAAAVMTLCFVLTALDMVLDRPGDGWFWPALTMDMPLIYGGSCLWALFFRAKRNKPLTRTGAGLALAFLLLPLVCQALPACVEASLYVIREQQEAMKQLYLLRLLHAAVRLALLLQTGLLLFFRLRQWSQWRGGGCLWLAVLCFLSASLAGLDWFTDPGRVLFAIARVCAMSAYLLGGFYLLRCRYIARSFG